MDALPYNQFTEQLALTAQQLSEQIHDSAVSNSGDLSQLSTEKREALYQQVKQLLTKYFAALKSAQETNPVLLQTHFQNRRVTIVEATRILVRILEVIPFETLTPEQLDEYVEYSALQTDEPVNKVEASGGVRTNGYYEFGSHGSYFEKPQWEKLRDAASSWDPSNEPLPLNDSELAIVQEQEDAIFKLHLSFSNSLWQQVFKALMTAKRYDIRLAEHLKKENGQSPTRAELVATGAKLQHLAHWKIISPAGNLGPLPSLVCYCFGTSAEAQVAFLNTVSVEIQAVLEEADIRLDPISVPRFSTPVSNEYGEAVPGFFYTQSDGDWKIFLKTIGKLGEVYNADFNYAIKK